MQSIHNSYLFLCIQNQILYVNAKAINNLKQTLDKAWD